MSDRKNVVRPTEIDPFIPNFLFNLLSPSPLRSKLCITVPLLIVIKQIGQIMKLGGHPGRKQFHASVYHLYMSIHGDNRVI
jgi:hypothetical protein